MEKLFIPYELALIAKNKGFNDFCLAYFSNSNLYINAEDNSGTNKNTWLEKISKHRNENFISAPLYQQVIDWLRDEKNIQIIELPKCKTEKGYFQFSIYRIKGDTGKFENDRIRIKALNKAIEQAFTLLP